MERFDPFAVLGVERRYDLDPGEIQRRYLDRSATLHPDLLGSAGHDAVGADADEGGRAAELNRAREILEDPEQRAVALWQLWGGAEDKSLPPGFLMEIMEVREEIAEASDSAAHARWETWARQRRAEYQRRVGELFAALAPSAPGNATTLGRIKLELNAWRYIERLVEQLG